MQSEEGMYQRVFRRVFDLLIVLPALPVVLPLIAVIALVIRLDSPGPAFLPLSRRGRDGRLFQQWRFRCLYMDAPIRAFRASQGDCAQQMVTRPGHLLLTARLNTLPMIFNVIGGSMSLVGPAAQPAFPARDQRTEVLALRPGLFAPESRAGGGIVCRGRGSRASGPVQDFCIVMRGLSRLCSVKSR